MISIIICSRDPEALQQASLSVSETIGLPYEIIAIDNSKGKYGICQAYNLGAARSRYEILCFMHEDLKFHTDGWGQTVVRILADPTAGVLGVAGATYQLKAPTSWIGVGPPCLRINVLHSTGKPILEFHHWNPKAETISEVATLDGLWLCCRKEVWKESPFDHKTFPHFHFYDIDFCTKIFPKHKILVTYEILIEHFSAGTFGKDWTLSALKYFKARQPYLPFGSIYLPAAEIKREELHVFHYFIRELVAYKAAPADILYCLYQCLAIDLWNKDTLYLAKKYIKHKTLSTNNLDT